jgi:Ni/Co efflux regulator RcnB
MTLRSLVLASALLVATFGATAAQAQYYHPHHHWHDGDRYSGPRHFVHAWERYRLPPPPYGYGWVRDGHAFLLLSRDGRIVRVWGP